MFVIEHELTAIGPRCYRAPQSNVLSPPAQLNIRMNTESRPAISAPGAWVVLCAWSSAAGRGLSAAHRLSAAGYAVAAAFGIVALFAWKRMAGAVFFPRGVAARARRRFRRPLPRAFLIFAGLTLLGGLVYTPSNYDALAYRV